MRITKFLFYFADTCARLLAVMYVLLAILYAVFGQTIAKFDGLPIPITFHTTITVLVLLIAAIGAWRLTQRKLWGLIAICLPAVLVSVGLALFYLFFVVLIFATPHVLAVKLTKN